MEKVKEFDKMLEKINDYDFVMIKFVVYICVTLGCLLMIMPFDEMNSLLCVGPYLLCSIGVYFYLSLYLYIGKEKKSVFSVLKWMPVEENEIYKVRREYLDRFVLKIAVVIFVLQQISAVIDHSFNIWNILYPLAVAVLIWLSGVLCIKMAKNS